MFSFEQNYKGLTSILCFMLTRKHKFENVLGIEEDHKKGRKR